MKVIAVQKGRHSAGVVLSACTPSSPGSAGTVRTPGARAPSRRKVQSAAEARDARHRKSRGTSKARTARRRRGVRRMVSPRAEALPRGEARSAAEAPSAKRRRSASRQDAMRGASPRRKTSSRRKARGTKRRRGARHEAPPRRKARMRSSVHAYKRGRVASRCVERERTRGFDLRTCASERGRRGRLERRRVERDRSRGRCTPRDRRALREVAARREIVERFAPRGCHAPRSHHAWRVAKLSCVARSPCIKHAECLRERIEHVVALSAGASGTSVRALNDERAESTAMYSSRRARVRRARAYARLLTCARVQVRTLAMHHEAIVSSEAIVRREFIVHQTHRVRERVERVVASSAGASSASVCAASDLRTCASERERCGRVERRCVERDRVRAKHVVCENTRPTGRMRVPQFPPSPQFPVVVRAATT